MGIKASSVECLLALGLSGITVFSMKSSLFPGQPKDTIRASKDDRDRVHRIAKDELQLNTDNIEVFRSTKPIPYPIYKGIYGVAPISIFKQSKMTLDIKSSVILPPNSVSAEENEKIRQALRQLKNNTLVWPHLMMAPMGPLLFLNPCVPQQYMPFVAVFIAISYLGLHVAAYNVDRPQCFPSPR